MDILQQCFFANVRSILTVSPQVCQESLGVHGFAEIQPKGVDCIDTYNILITTAQDTLFLVVIPPEFNQEGFGCIGE